MKAIQIGKDLSSLSHAVGKYAQGEAHLQFAETQKKNSRFSFAEDSAIEKHFKKERIQLGEFQQLVRGDKALPIFGLPDVVTAMRGIPYKDGRMKITHGESYIGMVRFTPSKTYYESVISFGNSRRPESPHYTDQMDLYAKFKTKTMSFERAEVEKTAMKTYAPK